MSQDRHILVAERAQQTVRHLLRLLVEGRVYAGDHDIHLLQHLI